MNGKYIIYPENRFMTVKQIEMAYSDAVANNEAENGFTELNDKISALEDAGLFTFTCDGESANHEEQRQMADMEREYAEFEEMGWLDAMNADPRNIFEEP